MFRYRLVVVRFVCLLTITLAIAQDSLHLSLRPAPLKDSAANVDKNSCLGSGHVRAMLAAGVTEARTSPAGIRNAGPPNRLATLLFDLAVIRHSYMRWSTAMETLRNMIKQPERQA